MINKNKSDDFENREFIHILIISYVILYNREDKRDNEF